MMKNATEAVIKINDGSAESFNSTADFSFRKSKDTHLHLLFSGYERCHKDKNKNHTSENFLSIPVISNLLLQRIYCWFHRRKILLQIQKNYPGRYRSRSNVTLSGIKNTGFTQIYFQRRKFILHFLNLHLQITRSLCQWKKWCQAFTREDEPGCIFILMKTLLPK